MAVDDPARLRTGRSNPRVRALLRSVRAAQGISDRLGMIIEW